MFCFRQSTSNGPNQFWWQTGPQDNNSSRGQSHKRALFPVQVLEYSDDGIRGDAGQGMPSKAALPPLAEHLSSSKEAVSLHSKGVVRMTAMLLARLMTFCSNLLKFLLADTEGCKGHIHRPKHCIIFFPVLGIPDPLQHIAYLAKTTFVLHCMAVCWQIANSGPAGMLVLLQAQPYRLCRGLQPAILCCTRLCLE